MSLFINVSAVLNDPNANQTNEKIFPYLTRKNGQKDYTCLVLPSLTKAINLEGSPIQLQLKFQVAQINTNRIEARTTKGQGGGGGGQREREREKRTQWLITTGLHFIFFE